MLRKVLRAGAYAIAQRTEADPDERLVHGRALSQGDVDLLADQIDHHIREAEVKLDPGVLRMKLAQKWQDELLPKSDGRSEPNESANLSRSNANVVCRCI